MSEGKSYHQHLMNLAYDRWQKGGDLEDKSTSEFHAALPKDQLKAVLLGNLNYQVENGGFSQWVFNGYACECSEVMEVLEEMGTELALKVHSMLARIRPHLDCDGGEDRGCFGSYWEQIDDEHEEMCCNCHGNGEVWVEDEDDEEDGGSYEECGYCDDGYERWTETVDSPEGIAIAEELDDQYYAINKEFMEEAEKFLKGEELVKAKKEEVKPVKTKTKPRVKLIGEDGNAFYILGKVKAALRKAGLKEEAEKFMKEATSGDYNHLLATAMGYVEVY